MNEIVMDLPPGEDNPRNSEGAFVTLTDGSIMFAYTLYSGENSSDHAPAVIAARYSSDQGRTWDSEDRVLVEREGTCNVMSVSLLRLQDGRIGLFYLRKNSVLDCHPYVRFSSDEGQTWGDSICCVPAPGYYVLNNDRVIQLASGRLIVPVGYHRSKVTVLPEQVYGMWESRAIAMYYLSDDGGETWREAADWWALPVPSNSGLQEPGAVALTDDKLYGYARTDVGQQWEMRSDDGGEHWTPPQPSCFQGPNAPLSIKRLATGDLLAVWNDHSTKPDDTADSSWGRTPLAVAISRDEGQTWGPAKLVETDRDRGFCYIAIHPLEDAVLLAYCCGGVGHSVLSRSCVRRISHDWLYA